MSPAEAAPAEAILIAIPCHDDGTYLLEAAESALGQSAPARVVIVDDGSTDDRTLGVLEQLSRDPSIVLLRQENRGLPAARNAAIAEQPGNYIVCLDADDRLDPLHCERLREVLEGNPPLGFAYPSVKMFGESSRRWHIPAFNGLALLADNIVPYCGMFRRSVWESAHGYAEELSDGYEDWDFWLSALEHGWIGAYVPDVCFSYRRRPGSLISRANTKRPELKQKLRRRHPSLYSASWVRSRALGHPGEVPAALAVITRELLRSTVPGR